MQWGFAGTDLCVCGINFKHSGLHSHDCVVIWYDLVSPLWLTSSFCWLILVDGIIPGPKASRKKSGPMPDLGGWWPEWNLDRWWSCAGAQRPYVACECACDLSSVCSGNWGEHGTTDDNCLAKRLDNVPSLTTQDDELHLTSMFWDDLKPPNK